MGRLGHVVAVAVVLAALGAPGVSNVSRAAAQAPDAQRTAAARSLFQEGLAAVEQHDWPAAVDRFRRVLELRESAAVRLNLGLALVQTGKLVEASELLRNASQDATATESVRHQASSALAQLDSRIGRVTVHVDGQQAGDDVTFDGAPMSTATLGVAVPADPGDHTVALVRAGHPIATRTVTVAEGATAEVSLAPDLAVTPEAAAVAPPPPTTIGPHEPALYERWWFWAAVGGTVALVAVIAIVAVVASSSAQPVAGNLDPSVLHVQVMP